MFEALFRQLEAALPGLRAIAVVGDDGIEVESHVRSELPHEVLSAEMNGILRNIDRLRREMDLGTLSEVMVRTDLQNILLFSLAEGVFILAVTDPAEATGRTRYEVQRVAHAFLDILK